MLMTLAKLVNDFRQLLEYNKTGLTQQQNAKPGHELAKMIAIKAAYLFVFIGLPLLLTSYPWWLLLVVFLTMHLTAGILMSIVFQMAHIIEGAEQPLPNSQGTIENEWAVHELLTTANFARNNRFLSWMIGGLNFQIEHHLFPGICHIHYRKLSPIVEQTAKEFGLRYNYVPTFRAAFLSHIRMLKSLGRA
jgi:linoleoyl-CoA desaturase